MSQLGFIGADVWASALCCAVAKQKNVGISGVYSADDSAELLAKTYTLPSAADVETLLADAEVICVDVPAEERLSFIREALDAGKRVVSAFPPAVSAEGLEDLKSLSGKTVKFGQPLRSRTEYKKLKDTVKSGDLGTIGMVRIGVCAPKPSDWRADTSLSGGALVDAGAGVFDFINDVFGGFVRVYGADAKSDNGGEYYLLVAKLKSGAIAHIEISWTELGVVGYDYYEVSGSNGILDYDSRREPVFQLDNGSGSKVITVGDHWSDVELKSILANDDKLVGVEEAAAALEIALKVKDGIAKGEVVTFA